jgi:hypothetical protein
MHVSCASLVCGRPMRLPSKGGNESDSLASRSANEDELPRLFERRIQLKEFARIQRCCKRGHQCLLVVALNKNRRHKEKSAARTQVLMSESVLSKELPLIYEGIVSYARPNSLSPRLVE